MEKGERKPMKVKDLVYCAMMFGVVFLMLVVVVMFPLVILVSIVVGKERLEKFLGEFDI